jgi:hypothetical protein
VNITSRKGVVFRNPPAQQARPHPHILGKRPALDQSTRGVEGSATDGRNKDAGCYYLWSGTGGVEQQAGPTTKRMSKAKVTMPSGN